MSAQNIEESINCIQRRKFEEGIKKVTKNMGESECPERTSVLYANRGTLYWSLGRYKQAKEDMEKSVEINHLNYVAYFNLFAIEWTTGYKWESLKNLCCGLSSLYLLRGEIHKSESDINKALKYAENNLEARVSKCLFHLNKKKHKLALNELNWALEIQPHNVRLQMMKTKIQKMGGDYSETASQESLQSLPLRLQCSTFEEEQESIDVDEMMEEKLAEFNELYQQINGEYTSLICNSPNIHLLHLNQVSREEREVSEEDSFQRQKSKKLSLFYRVEEEARSVGSDSIDDLKKDHLIFEKNLYQSSLESKSKKSDFCSTPENSTYTLQGPEEGKSISIKVHKIQVPDHSEEKVNSLYCQFDYGKKGSSNLFNESFEASLDDQPQVLHIKVFKKQYHAFSDKFLGEGLKQITMTGRIQVPISIDSKKDPTGMVYLDIKFK